MGLIYTRHQALSLEAKCVNHTLKHPSSFNLMRGRAEFSNFVSLSEKNGGCDYICAIWLKCADSSGWVEGVEVTATQHKSCELFLLTFSPKGFVHSRHQKKKLLRLLQSPWRLWLLFNQTEHQLMPLSPPLWKYKTQYMQNAEWQVWKFFTIIHSTLRSTTRRGSRG